MSNVAEEREHWRKRLKGMDYDEHVILTEGNADAVYEYKCSKCDRGYFTVGGNGLVPCICGHFIVIIREKGDEKSELEKQLDQLKSAYSE